MLSKKTWGTAAALFIGSWIAFLVYIQFPTKPNFDEFHYIPAMKQLVELPDSKDTSNWEHPPLAKEIMAIGLAIAGDRPLGWRLSSTFFGALTLLGVFFLGLYLFESRTEALWVSALTFVNQLLYVQSRIAMLDTFMFAFMIWALVFYARALMTGTRQLDDGARTRMFLAMGISIGAAMACKWFAITLWGLLAVLTVWTGIRLGQWLWAFVAAPIATYTATWLPYLAFDHGNRYRWSDFWELQTRAYDGQLRVLSAHPYMSQWWQWPLLHRPIWYAYDGVDAGHVRGVLLLGNPIIMGAGLIALVYLVYAFLSQAERRRSPEIWLPLATYAAFFLSWILIPRKIAFYYYYYPAAMMLGFALSAFFRRTTDPNPDSPWVWSRWVFLGASAALFAYFFPILSGSKIANGEFLRYMWRSTWI